MTLEENNYGKCIGLLRAQWPNLVKIIEDADIEQAQQGTINFLCDDHGEKRYLPAQSDALKEAEKRFEGMGLHSGLKTIFHYGLGAGYDYLAVKKWLSEDVDRLLIVLEDDFGLIKTFFKTDLAVELLSNPQVLLVPIETQIQTKKIKFPIGFEMIMHVGIRDTYIIVFSNFYQETRNAFCRALKQFIHMRIQDFVWLFAFNDSIMVKDVFNNLIHNLISLPSMSHGSDLFEQFKGIPALLCAAGPSIKNQLPLIKRLKNRALLFGAGTGMNTLNALGIIPHFGCGIDPNKSSESRLLMNSAFSVPYFQTVHFNYLAAQLIHGQRLFIRGPESYGTISWMIETIGLKDPQVHFNVSTTCACLMLAEKLHCAPVIFLGLDLSYTEQRRYPEGVIAHPTDKLSETRFIEQLPKGRVIPLINSKGNRIFTRSDWINEGAYYSFYAKEHPKHRLINATVEGLQIRGIDEMPLEDIEKMYLVHSYDLDNWVHVEVMLSKHLQVNHEQVRSLITQWQQSLKKGEEILRKMIKDLLDTDENLNAFPEEVGSKTYHELKDALKEEPIYQHLIKETDFAFEKKMMRDQIFLRFHAHLLDKEERYQRMLMIELYRLKYLHKFVKIQLKGIKSVHVTSRVDEALAYSRKNDVAVPDVDYIFDGKRLTIVDAALGINLDDLYTPRRIQEKSEKIEVNIYAFMEKGIPDGECILYDKKGWLKGRWFYKKGKLHGPSHFYGPDGTVLAKGWFFNNERQGVNLQFYPSGKVYSVQRFKDGIEEGSQRYYYENGEMKTAYSFANGVLDGKVELFFPDGKKKREVFYVQGKRHGKEFFWSLKGQLIRESEYDCDRSVGIARIWYANGQLRMEKKFVDDKGNFDFREWSKEGRLMAEKIYIPGMLSHDLLQSQAQRSKSLEELKRKMEGLVDDQNS